MSNNEQVVAGFGGGLGRGGVIGSEDGIVKSPEARRDLYLYGQRIIADGDLLTVQGDASNDGQDIILTSNWQRVTGCNVTVPRDLGAGAGLIAVNIYLENLGGNVASLELGVSKEGGTWPAAALTLDAAQAVPDQGDGPTAVGGYFADECETGDVLFLWARLGGGTALTIKGATYQTEMLLAASTGVGLDQNPTLSGNLNTEGNGIIFEDGLDGYVGVVGGALGARPGDLILAHVDSEGGYEPNYGGIAMTEAQVELHGQTTDIISPAVTFSGLTANNQGGALLVDANGHAYVREEEQSVAEGDTSTSTQDVTLNHDVVTGLNMTLANSYEAAKAHCFVSLSFTNGNSRTGTFNFAVRVDGVELDTVSAPVDATGPGTKTIDLPIPQALTAGDAIDVVCWRTDTQQFMNLSLNGDVTVHELVVYQQAIGTGEGEANTLASIGSGAVLNAAKTGTVLNLKSITGTNGVGVTTNATDMTIDGSALENAGTAQGLMDTHKAGADQHSINGVTGLTAAGDGTQYLANDGTYKAPAVAPVTGASMEYEWDTDTAATAPDSPGGVKGNNATDASITAIYISDLTAKNNDFSFLFPALAPGDFLQIAETSGGKDGANTFQVTAAATDNTGWWTIPVVNVHSEGTMSNNADVIVTYVQDPANKLPPGGATGQALIKSSSADYDTEWGASGGGSSAPAYATHDQGTDGNTVTASSNTITEVTTNGTALTITTDQPANGTGLVANVILKNGSSSTVTFVCPNTGTVVWPATGNPVDSAWSGEIGLMVTAAAAGNCVMYPTTVEHA